MSGWENFLVAQVGASAALAGLVFVGVSINQGAPGRDQSVMDFQK
jgi:hypothetical protein